ncbi:hypothetical protein [Nitrospina gracilis]|uniref:hypothetical protein n=1 Tax=Nitrospina gracilis TaxID=35801 RepID=UPI001F25211C|nr:hypothetical protein [Nitrospina gracilis]MCF8719238.1 hypothetical protein [Nitrospina gracilis Nb-211]
MKKIFVTVLLVAAFAFGFFYRAPFENEIRPAHAGWVHRLPKGQCSESIQLMSNGGNPRKHLSSEGTVRACVWNIDSISTMFCGVVPGRSIDCIHVPTG